MRHRNKELVTILLATMAVCGLLIALLFIMAVNMLQGKEVDTSKLGGANGLSFVIPLAAVITKDNLEEGLAMCEGKPDAFLLDDIMSDEDVLSTYFQ